LGKKVTFGRDLTRMGHKLFGRKYAGTFPADMIPDLDNQTRYTILNLDNSDQPGSHWIACGFAPQTGKVLVYDSFGRQTNDIIPSLVNKFGSGLEMVDDDPEQDIHEQDCGARCLAFLYVLDRKGGRYAREL
jgi:hypothetical protein